MRDKDPKRYLGKGVLNAIENVQGEMAAKLKGQEVDSDAIDQLLIELDGRNREQEFKLGWVPTESLESRLRWLNCRPSYKDSNYAEAS